MKNFMPQVDVRDAVHRKCVCGNEYFVQVFRLGAISKMSPTNPTGQDILVKFEIYLCNKCDLEYGREE